MVALLKDDGELLPTPVVRDREKFDQLVEAMNEEPKVLPGLLEMLRDNRKQQVTPITR